MVWKRFLLALVFCVAARHVVADEDWIECRKGEGFITSMDSPDYRKYAPDREVQMIHLALDVIPDFKKRTVDGVATLKFAPVAKPVSEVKLDAIDLRVKEIESTQKIAAYNVTEKSIDITFAEAIPAGNETSVTVRYGAEPKAGMYFRTPEMGYKEGDTHLFTQGEEIEARNWYPCLDSPNQRFTSEITCRLPQGMTSISNGRLVSQETDAQSDLTVFHWSQEKPQANYLISLVAGYFKRLEDQYKDVPLTFYAPPSEIDYASNSFQGTKDMMAFYEEEIGVAYPWAKYSQTCVNDFVEGGMENTSCTTLTDGTLFTDATENIRSSEGLIAHELAHQWFGDLVTCKDWSHIWLNESFATFYQTLYRQHAHGREALQYELYSRAQQITSVTNNFNAIVRRTFESSHEMFDYLAYPKGGWVLHMLRCALGDDLYRKCIKTYLERFQYRNVVTEDLRKVIEELSGRSFDQFFDQWLYHGYFPELKIVYSWDEKKKLAKINVKQTQPVDEKVVLFRLPTVVRFAGDFGTRDTAIGVKERDEDFYFPLPAAPKIARFDPEYTLLAKITFPLPKPMLYAQLGNTNDMIGRLHAIEQLSGLTDKETIEKLKLTLNNDAFYGARIEASRALKTIHSDDALKALVDSTSQVDARVRRAVMSDIAAFYTDLAYKTEQKLLDEEKNPDVIAPALKGVAEYAKPAVEKTLGERLASESFRNDVADAAIAAMRVQGDPKSIVAITNRLTLDGTNFTTRGIASALDTVAYLCRNEERRDTIRKFLTGYLTDKRERVQIGAIAALGVLGDDAALPVLEPLAASIKDSPAQNAAEKAIAKIREARKPSDDLKTLRDEMLALQKQNREMRKDLNDVQKLAGATKPTESKAKKTSTLRTPKAP